MTPNPTRSLTGLLALAAGGLALGAAATGAAAPVISGSDADAWNAANPSVEYTITTASRRSRIYWAIPGVASGDGRSPLRVRPGTLPDGAYRLLAIENLNLQEDVAIRSFRVDTTPPVVTIRRPVAGELLARGSRIAADYACEGAVTCAGPVGPGGLLDLSVAGPAAFRVSAVDDAGNEAVGLVDYVVRPPVAAAATRARPRILNARAMRPRPGVRVTSRRPTLRWRGLAGARLYNVQLYRLRRGKATKVLSAFPRRSRLRIPPRTLAFGGRYAWRVWPYRANGYPKRPLGLSYFDVRRPRAR